MSHCGSTNLNQRARYRVIQEFYDDDDISSKCKAKAQWARETRNRRYAWGPCGSTTPGRVPACPYCTRRPTDGILLEHTWGSGNRKAAPELARATVFEERRDE